MRPPHRPLLHLHQLRRCQYPPRFFLRQPATSLFEGEHKLASIRAILDNNAAATRGTDLSSSDPIEDPPNPTPDSTIDTWSQASQDPSQPGWSQQAQFGSQMPPEMAAWVDHRATEERMPQSEGEQSDDEPQSDIVTPRPALRVKDRYRPGQLGRIRIRDSPEHHEPPPDEDNDTNLASQMAAMDGPVTPLASDAEDRMDIVDDTAPQGTRLRESPGSPPTAPPKKKARGSGGRPLGSITAVVGAERSSTAAGPSTVRRPGAPGAHGLPGIEDEDQREPRRTLRKKGKKRAT
ncbi:hypothetical protein PHLGIDRAFT_123130 [Phlebiopsis gigantea 11061_1 CR5-6]|uniref:Uncharacterized protein n=1 Tax=Phlebiopsis gigantea (strain 11061_1 CR5-6) TaxID=745531 RepID=A0A0C3NB16_PHLG1|nr:hypothetical protein PHLGIDRAFT_123130 [Phlebiopsis gigantea 11061_1 CR5-6]